MARPVVQVRGARELRRSLRKAGGDMQQVKTLHAEVGGIVAGAARPATPHRSGRLAGTVRSSGTQTASIVRAGRASVPYAGPIHYGWPARHIKPQPWMTEAARATEPRWFATFTAGIERILATIRGA